MTDYVSDAPPGGAGPSRYPPASHWVGWIAFAGVLMVILGALHAFQGLVAIFKDEYFLVSSSGLAVKFDFTTWGWVQLVVGIVVAVAGVCVMAGQVWARAVGVLLASLSLLANVAFLAAYPLWSLIMIAVDIVIIMALTVHGQDIRPDITPNQGRLGWAVGWGKDEFWGRDVLLAEKEAGPDRILRGIFAAGRAIPRPGMGVSLTNDLMVGEVTSGTFSPTLKRGIGLAIVSSQVAEDAEVGVDVRGRREIFNVTRPPFVDPSVKES